MAYGTLTTLDTLAGLNNTTVAELGENTVFNTFADALRIHNALVADKLGSMVERTTDRLRRYGAAATMVMDEIDQFGTPDAQKATAGQNVGFPLRLYGISVQWTRKFLENATPAELAAQFTAAQDADALAIEREIKRAIFRPTNTTFLDRLVDSVELPVKALINADSSTIPLGPGNTTFNGATHTHYLGTASFAAADLTSLVETVIEHYPAGRPMIYINRAQETTVRGFTGFTAYTLANLVPATSAASIQGINLDPVALYNRAIGQFGNSGAEVWVKSWIPAGYVFAFMEGAPAPLAMRTRRPGTGDLVIAAEDESHPLRARVMEREFGIGVWNRTNGAVLDTANATYSAPTIS